MKRKKRIKIVLTLLILALSIGAFYYFLLPSAPNSNIAIESLPDNLFGWKFPVAKFPSTGSGDKFAYSSIRDPGGIPVGLPVSLNIPIIGVDSAIEDALITPDGKMDVPAGSVNVAWFALGPHPGQIGSAVIGGHYGITNGVPFVFYKLDKMKIGDKVNIIDDQGKTLTFIVRSIKSFDRNADATTVFSSSDGLAHLNLITCEGIWNKVNDSYPERLVVFTDLLPENGSINQQNPSISTFSRSLRLGSSGVDVSALQSFLESKGLLVMPTGTTKGYFGKLTRSAVAKYQKNVGLPQVGAFGPLTMAKLNLEISSNPDLPNTNAISRNILNDLPSPKNFFLKFKILYDTPADGLITSSLLIAIALLVFKIRKKNY